MTARLDMAVATQFVARLHAAVNAHDAEGIAALCSEDVEWNDPAAARPLRGRAEVAEFHRLGMFRALPDVRIEVTDGPYLLMDGSGIAVRATIAGTMSGPLHPPGFAATGTRVEFQTAEFSLIRDGLLVRHTVILNMLELARQIGAFPDSGSLGERVGVAVQHASASVMRRRARRQSRGR
ncbi:MAG: nuclear transport factor 2 family protein [Gemmatimonadetes bacterium]|nr:nuclear transport factor 2 family protein [Gemmatimonadota bacterium]